MNRIHFFVLVGLGSLFLLLLAADLYLSHRVAYQQAEASQIQQALTQGQTLAGNLRQLVLRINGEVQKSGDQGLKDLLARQQLAVKSTDGATNATDAPATPSPSSSH